MIVEALTTLIRLENLGKLRTRKIVLFLVRKVVKFGKVASNKFVTIRSSGKKSVVQFILVVAFIGFKLRIFLQNLILSKRDLKFKSHQFGSHISIFGDLSFFSCLLEVSADAFLKL